MGSALKVSHVRIQSVLGIDELEFSPGGFTEVSGANGSGKTSTIEALRAALRGGHDATLLRQGADRGEIVLVLDDGTQIKKSITAEGTNVVVLRDEKKLSRPAEAIKGLHDALSVNPVEFLRAPDKARVDALLAVMPVRVDAERVRELLPVNFVKGSLSVDGLAGLESIKKSVFDERTAVNRMARDKEGAVNQLRATLPEVVDEAPATDASLLAEVDAIDKARDAEVDRVNAKLGTMRSEHEARVAALQAQIDAERAAFAEVKGKADSALVKAKAAHSEARARVQARLDAIEQAQKAQARYAVTRENIARMSDELGELKTDAAGMTAALEGLDAYKAELLAALPVPGLEVAEGKLFRYGVPFDRLNTAQQVEIAVEVAKLRAGELGLICVDGLELLDDEHFEAFKAHAEASGLQLIVSRVSAGPLSIRTEAAQCAA